jgi:hypothetical protein
MKVACPYMGMQQKPFQIGSRGEIINKLLLSIIQRSRSLEHVHIVAGISWIRVMCWNPREPRPHPTYLLASVANFFACLSKMQAKVPVCFNFFNFHPVCTKYPMNIQHIILTNRMLFLFLELLLFGG